MQESLEYEQEHVHDVYEQIASHFSSTRYKPWPIIEKFLLNQPVGAVGLDVGCGNGKYLAVNPNIFIVGSDRSTNLTKIAAKHKNHAAIVADILELPHPKSQFDFAISIAVIHHLASTPRRVEAIESILETLTDQGQTLLYCWALEQESSRRGWSENDDQDVMVPWVMRSGKKSQATATASQSGDKTFHRYYHLYRKGELEQDIQAAGGIVVEAGYEKDNWWAVAQKAPNNQPSK